MYNIGLTYKYSINEIDVMEKEFESFWRKVISQNGKVLWRNGW